ncbi:MAG: response regulator [Lachnospiraceae bacterium]|nr:response regulator [Lachnospiraceae bacterium]
MTLLEIFMGIAAALCTAGLLFSVRNKHLNMGYILTTMILIATDLVCILLMRCETIKNAKTLFMIYYLLNSWMYFSAMWTIIRMSSGKWFEYSLIPMGMISALQSFLIIVCFNRPRTMNFSREYFLGSIWWVVNEMDVSKGFLSFNTYMILCYISCGSILVLLVFCFIRTGTIFRTKYVIIAICQALLMAMYVINFTHNIPIWVLTLVMNPVCYFTYYYAFLQADMRLRETTLMAFANDMTDGLILYNRHNDLIHVNEPIKRIPDPELQADLEDINRIEDWFSRVERIEGLDVLYFRNEGQEAYYVAKKKILGSKKVFAGTVYTFRDVTNTVGQLQAMEKANDELERTARMKSDFLANMSHELRTPMNAVIGMTEIALREELPVKVRDCLNQISRSGINLLNIINDILDYSKIEAGKMEIVAERYEPLSEVNDISNILQTRIGDKPLNLFFMVDPSLPKEFLGDSMRIRQVLINIANNAIKFTEKGMVKIQLNLEWVSEDEVVLDFHVTDTGIGIKKDDLERLFVSFQQINSKRNRNVEGTGLGLTISKKLCEAMGGSIGIESEYGKGTHVWFKIPQKVTNPEKALVVEEAQNKYVFCYNENDKMTEQFAKELIAFGVQGRIISSLEQYVETGKKEFLFIENTYYTPGIMNFLDKHPDVTCVVLMEPNDEIRTERKNIRVMNKPMNTLGLVLMLNGKDPESFGVENVKKGTTSFTAPNAKILIVDDNTVNLTIAEGLLEPIKVKCTSVESGDEAIKILKKKHFDLILMDHMMPGMDGVEATQIIRRDIPEAADTPIIALTANVAEGSLEMFIKAGMADLIAKPIDVRQLNSKLLQWLPEDKIKEKKGQKEDEVSDTVVSDAEEMFDCLDCAKAVEGLGSTSLFRKIVADYYRKGPAIYEAIEKAISEADWNDYTIRMHALKSTSRQIGALELGDMAEKLEMAGKAAEAEAVEMYHTVTMSMFKKLLDDLSKYFDEGNDEDKKEQAMISDVELKEIFEKLREACEELDMDRMEECGELLGSKTYPEDKREIIDNLCEAIEQMDTDVCNNLMDDYYAE